MLLCHLNRLLPLFSFSFSAQPLADAFVPRHHVLVWCLGKATTRQDLWKQLSSVRIFDVPHLDCLAKKSRMLFRAKQELNCLPHDPPFGLERRYRWICEGDRMRVVYWLQ